MPRTRYEPEPRSRCCVRCFRDPYMRAKIRQEGERGNCDWCGSMGVKTIHISELSEDFREAVRQLAYEGSDGRGETLDFILEDGFAVFSEALDEDGGSKRRELLLGILEYGLHPKDDVDDPDFRSLFVRRNSSPADLPGRWDERLEALVRHPPGYAESAQGRDDVDLLQVAVGEAGLQRTITRPYFRARIHTERGSSELIPLAKMGAPRPDQFRKGARANRAGEAVLYLASDEQTALAEVRAWRRAVVAIAKMELRRPVVILNTMKVKRVTTPFGENYGWLRDVAMLLRQFGRELSRPVAPNEEESEYRPSQHVCELARAGHLDGVLYPSAMGGGHNLVLFDPDLPVPTTVKYFRVGHPTFRKERYAYAEMRWDDADDWA